MDCVGQVRTIVNSCQLTLIATSFVAITVVSAIIAFHAYTAAAYIQDNFAILNAPHYILGYIFAFIFGSTAMLLLFSIVCLRSKVWRKVIAGLGVLTILSFIISFWSFIVLDSRTVNETYSRLRYGIVTYHLDNSSTRAMDAIQKELSCCGIKGYEDWRYNYKYGCASKKEPLTCGIPPSCCSTKQDKILDDYCGHGNDLFDTGKMENRVIPIIPEDTLMHTEGCLAGAERTLDKSARAILFYIMFLLIIQIYSLIALFSVDNLLKSSNQRNTDSFPMNTIRLNNRRRRRSQRFNNEGLNTVMTDSPTGVNENSRPSTSTHVFPRNPASTQSRFLTPRPTYMSPFTRTVHFEDEQDPQNLIPVEGAMGYEETTL